MAELGESLTDADPAALKEPFRRMVSKITCQWSKVAPKTPNGRTKSYLDGGNVELRPALAELVRTDAPVGAS